MRRKLKKRYDAIIFDVADTLLVREPKNCEILMERCQEIGLIIDQDTAHRAWRRSELWMGEQILREMHGAPRMSDRELHQCLDFIALQTAFADRTEDELGYCQVGKHGIVNSYFTHMGEEPFLVPSFTIFFWGCTFSCQF